ncbi:MAG TPA: SRPBCC family protein [Bauldia sp.]|nr:SRPBCC family protein [Bauldia sp.]
MKRAAVHSTFVIERTYPASPAKVFKAFADKEAKEKWFGGPPEWGPEQHQMDFRVGGMETSTGGPKGGPVIAFRAIYLDIVPNERLIYAYDMDIDGKRISASLATIEITPEGRGTHLKITEQGAYLDGHDDAGKREHGTRELLDKLGASLA